MAQQIEHLHFFKNKILWLILDWDVSSDSLHSASVEEYSDSRAQLIDQVAADTELLQVPASCCDKSEQVRQWNVILYYDTRYGENELLGFNNQPMLYCDSFPQKLMFSLE